jgi:hypothetical protein
VEGGVALVRYFFRYRRTGHGGDHRYLAEQPFQCDLSAR